MPVIRISDTLYERLGKLAVNFDTPANVIEKLLNEYDGINEHEEVTSLETKIILNRKKMTQEMIEKTYLLAKDVYEQKILIKDAQTALVNKLNMNKTSAMIYLNNFQKMMVGECYKRAMNAAATEYYLKKIHFDFGIKNFKNALSSFDQHIKYYKQFSKKESQKDREIYKKFS